jgi:hypothetical protein
MGGEHGGSVTGVVGVAVWSGRPYYGRNVETSPPPRLPLQRWARSSPKQMLKMSSGAFPVRDEVACDNGGTLDVIRTPMRFQNAKSRDSGVATTKLLGAS